MWTEPFEGIVKLLALLEKIFDCRLAGLGNHCKLWSLTLELAAHYAHGLHFIRMRSSKNEARWVLEGMMACHV